MIQAVLDANVIVSGIAGFRESRSIPGQLLRHWRRGDFRLLVSDHILVEVDRALRKPYYAARFTDQEVREAIALLQTEAHHVLLTAPIRGVATHPEDDPVLATAVSASADYLVTGDKQLQRLDRIGDVAILSPRAFFDVLRIEET